MHGKVSMREIIDAFQANKIFVSNNITSTTKAIVWIK